MYPDYDNSLLSLISSIENYYGIENKRKTLKIVDETLKNDYKNIIIVLYDGFGYNILKRNKDITPFLNENLKFLTKGMMIMSTGKVGTPTSTVFRIKKPNKIPCDCARCRHSENRNGSILHCMYFGLYPPKRTKCERYWPTKPPKVKGKKNKQNRKKNNNKKSKKRS